MKIRLGLMQGALTAALFSVGVSALATEDGFDPSSNEPDVPLVEWEKSLGIEGRLQTFGPDLLGDGIDPHVGGIGFDHADVVLPGNSHLEVALRRRISQGSLYHEDVHAEFGDWEHVVPRLHVVVADSTHWTGNRCSNSFATSFPMVHYGQREVAYGRDYSQGIKLDVPGAGSQLVLRKTAVPEANDPPPPPPGPGPGPGGDDPFANSAFIGQQAFTDDSYSTLVAVQPDSTGQMQAVATNQSDEADIPSTGKQWPAAATYVTTKNWYLTCTGNITGGGQGFIAHAPNGDQYRFDYFYRKKYPSLGTVKGVELPRWKAIVAATEVKDVNGNWVRYTYDSLNRLTRIHANDGREITLHYNGNSNLVSEVRTGSRVWRYAYRQTNYRFSRNGTSEITSEAMHEL